MSEGLLVPCAFSLLIAGCASSSSSHPPTSEKPPEPPSSGETSTPRATTLTPRATTLEEAFGGEVRCEASDEAARIVDGMLLLRQGHTVCVQVEPSGSSLSIRELVAAPGAQTVVLRLATGPGPNETLLTVHNPLSTPVKYRVGMKVPGHSEMLATSSCPVLPGRIGFEHWPHPIEGVALADFHPLDPATDSMTCE